jgi:hypothetical protein
MPSGVAYGSDGYGPWKDTAQYNYWNPDTRAARIKELFHVASLADAIRCDMAYLAINNLFGQVHPPPPTARHAPHDTRHDTTRHAPDLFLTRCGNRRGGRSWRRGASRVQRPSSGSTPSRR